MAAIAMAGLAFGPGKSACAASEEAATASHPTLLRINGKSEALAQWGDEIEKGSGYRILVKQVHLFADTDDLDQPLPEDRTTYYQVKSGQIEAGATAHFFWYQSTHVFREMAFCVRPFEFTDPKRMARFSESQAGRIITEALDEKGVHNLGWLPMGTLTNAILTNSRRPVLTPADFKGLRIRSTGEGVNEGLAALGAIPMTEHGADNIRNAILAGKCDGLYHGNLANIVDPQRGWNRVAKFLTVMPYDAELINLYVNPGWWARLPPDLQGIVTEATRALERRLWGGQEKLKQDSIARIRMDGGSELFEASPEQIEALRSAARPAFDEYYIRATGPRGSRILRALDSERSFKGSLPADPSLPPYKASASLAGDLAAVVPDHLQHVMDAWIQGFKKVQPNVNITTRVPGSGAIRYYLVGLGPNIDEIFAGTWGPYLEKNNYDPFGVVVSMGGFDTIKRPHAIAVFVHPSNPLQQATLAQLDAIFSITRRRGYPAPITTWGQLGLTGEWKDKPIHCHIPEPNIAATWYFRESVLFQGLFKSRNLVPEKSRTPEEMMEAVGGDPYAIGFQFFGYRTAKVKAIAIGNDHGEFVPLTEENVANGRYPIGRTLEMFVNRRPGAPLDPLAREFLIFVLSKDGQDIVANDKADGFQPVLSSIAREARDNLD